MNAKLFDGLTEFMAVAETHGFRSAAKQLAKTPAAVSQAIHRLEDRLGSALFHRTTRQVSLTEAGNILLGRLRPATDDIARTLGALDELRTRPAGLLRLSVHSMALPLLIEPVLPLFRRKHPCVAVDVDVQDAVVDLVAKGFDAGIRIGEFIEQDMVAIKASRPFRWVVLGAPSYLNIHGRPRSPSDLIKHQCIRYRSQASGAIAPWDFVSRGKTVQVIPKGDVTVNNRDLLCHLAAKGIGLIYTSEWAAQKYLRRHQLEVLLQSYLPAPDNLYLYFSARSQMQSKLRAFIDEVKLYCLSP